MLAQLTFKSVPRTKSPQPQRPPRPSLARQGFAQAEDCGASKAFLGSLQGSAALCLIFSVAEEALQSPRSWDAAGIWTRLHYSALYFLKDIPQLF